MNTIHEESVLTREENRQAQLPKVTDQLRVEVQEMSPFPPGDNPWEHDSFHRGTELPQNLLLFHPGPNMATDRILPYLILVNQVTGQRIKIILRKA